MKSSLSNVAITIAVLIVAVSHKLRGLEQDMAGQRSEKLRFTWWTPAPINDAVSGPHSARARQMAGYKRHSAKPQARKEASIATGTIDVYLGT